jgi:hypothetical protein
LDELSVVVGVILGALIAASVLLLLQKRPESVVFDRNAAGQITGIHYLPYGG